MKFASTIRGKVPYFAAVLALTSLATHSLARDLFVRADAEGGNGEQQSPFATISAALEAAQDGDTLRIAAGTYPEQIVLLKSGLKLKGGYNENFNEERDLSKNASVVDGQKKFRPIQIGDRGKPVDRFQLDGLTIANGLADGDEELDSKGGAILIMDASSGKIARCQLLDNRAADDGGAIESNGNGRVRLDRCLFRGNEAGDDGGAIRLQGSGSATVISNCIFDKNSGLDKYVVQAKGNTRILHCTFVGNRAEGRGIIASRSKVDSSTSEVTVINCVFMANESLDDDPLLFADDESVPIDATNCLFFENDASGGLGADVEIGSNGNRAGDPHFADAANGDFRLLEGSAAIDAAVRLGAIKKDFLGVSRSQGTGPDIGAFEFDPSTKVSQGN